MIEEDYEKTYEDFEQDRRSVFKKIGRNLPTKGIWWALIPIYAIMFLLNITKLEYYAVPFVIILIITSIGKEEQGGLLVGDQETAISIIHNALKEKQKDHSPEFEGLLKKGDIKMTGYCFLQYWDKLAHVFHVGWNIQERGNEQLHFFVSRVDPHTAGIVGNIKLLTEYDGTNFLDRETWIPPEFKKDMRHIEMLKEKGEI